MNQEIYTIDDYSVSVNHVQTPATPELAGLKAQGHIDGELRRVIDKILVELELQPDEHVTRSTRQMLLYIGNHYQGAEPRKFADYCRGLHLTSQLHFRAALAAFERVLVGQVAPEFEVFREMALRLHSVCLEQLDFDERSMEQFTTLLYRKFEETRANGRPDDVATLLGLGRAESPMPF